MTSILPPSASDPDDAELTERPRPKHARPDQYTVGERGGSFPVIVVAMVSALVIIGTILVVYVSLVAK